MPRWGLANSDCCTLANHVPGTQSGNTEWTLAALPRILEESLDICPRTAVQVDTVAQYERQQYMQLSANSQISSAQICDLQGDASPAFAESHLHVFAPGWTANK